MVFRQVEVIEPPLEESSGEELAGVLLELKRLEWDEAHFRSKLCHKIMTAPTSDGLQLRCSVSDSIKRSEVLERLIKRLQRAVEEAD